MSPNAGAKKNILVVEDDLVIRQTLKDLLELEGYSVSTAENGREGLEKMKASKPDLVLLDMLMPVMTGREFLDQVRKDTTLASIPVVVVSATADEPSTRGAKGFVKKPPDVEVLMSMITKYLG